MFRMNFLESLQNIFLHIAPELCIIHTLKGATVQRAAQDDRVR